MIRRLLLVLILLLPLPAAAQQTLEGSWALRLDGSIIMRWDLERDGGEWTGSWVKPDSFASDGQRFARIAMPAVEREADAGQSIGEWAELTFNNPDEEPDVFRFRLLGADRAEMIYAGTGLPPYSLERVVEDALLGPFVEGRVYGGERAPARAAARPETRPSPAAEEAPVQGPPAMIGR